MKNTELNAILAITEALMGYRLDPQYHATGHYAHSTRRVELDFGPVEVGPIIGQAGSMKLAIQTLLACPFGGDACQIIVRSTRESRREEQAPPAMAEPRIRKVLDALKDHYPPGRFHFKLEHSTSALVILIESSAPFVDDIRGAISKTLRSIGRRHGVVAVVSIEKTENACHA